MVPVYSMLDELTAMVKLMGSITKAIAESQLKGSSALGESLAYAKLMDANLKNLIVALGEKETLKSNFRKILEHYIAQRETLGWPVSATKKEELAKQVRNAVEKL